MKLPIPKWITWRHAIFAGAMIVVVIAIKMKHRAATQEGGDAAGVGVSVASGVATAAMTGILGI